jgi:hypothetical protein
MNFVSELSNQYLDSIYHNIQAEKNKLLSQMKTEEDQKAFNVLTKQVSILNHLEINLVKLKNIKNKPVKSND